MMYTIAVKHKGHIAMPDAKEAQNLQYMLRRYLYLDIANKVVLCYSQEELDLYLWYRTIGVTILPALGD
jgi:thermostable 8-oxoguanine DNA glycosylase